jgi:hypothetical protein
MKQDKDISMLQLSKFFIPLAAMPIMISLSHNIINAALARFPAPELSLAVFTLLKAVTNIFNAPLHMSRQTILTLVNDKLSFNFIMKFLWAVAGIMMLAAFTLGISPVGTWLLKNIVGLTDAQKILLIQQALMVTCLLPLVVLLRNVPQALATGIEKTHILIPGVVVRVIVISLFLWWSISTKLLTGVMAGSLTWIGGIALEGLTIIALLRYKFGALSNIADKMTSKQQEELRLPKVVKFVLPLTAMVLFMRFIQPIIQSGITRAQSSETTTLAAYGVAWGLVTLIRAPLRMLNQCTLVYVEGMDDPRWPTIKQFSLLVGMIISLVMLVIGLTPLGYWLLTTVMAVSAPIANLAQQVITAFWLFPIIKAWRESFWGLLMERETTGIISWAKAANVVTVISVIITGVLLHVPLSMAVIGAIAFTCGEGIESLVIWYYVTTNSCSLQVEGSQC